MPLTLTVTSWSRGGQSARDPALGRPAGIAGDPSAWSLPFEPDGRFYAGTLDAPVAGALVLEVTSPRPIRLFLNGLLALDETLVWRSFQRQVRAAVVVPAEAGEVSLLVEVGARPRHRESVDRHCPSRNRERTLRDIERRFPDRLLVAARVDALAESAEVPAVSLRYLTAQFVRDGVTYQHVLARPLSGFADAPPVGGGFDGTDFERTAEVARLGLWSSVAPGDAEEGTTDADRAAGLRRLYVPVANPYDAPAPLREVGAEETRPEPEIEVARTLDLSVNGVRVAMPAFESLGRLAPRHEFRPSPWPTWGEAFRDALPRPVLPGELARFADLYDATWQMLLERVRTPRADSGLPDGYISTGPGFRHYQFVWDTSFTVMAAAYGHAAGLPATASLDFLYSRQFDGGYLHREHDVRDGAPALYEPDFSPNPPILSVAEWKVACLTGDTLRLRRVYPALKAWHAWLKANRRLPDGTYWTTGLANGLDNSPSLGDGYPDLTAQMAHDADVLADIAWACGEQDECTAFRAEQAQIGDALNARLWSEEMGIYSTSLPGGGHNTNKVVTAFWPLWAGVVPPDRADALAARMNDPATFWRHHPLPSLAADSPEFVPGGDYWRGSVWAPTSYAAISGFWRAGYRDLAREATLRHLSVLHEVWAETGKLWENYSSEAPSRPGSTSQPDYCWTALGPIALLLEVVLGFEPDAMTGTLRWTLPAVDGTVGVRNYPLGRARVSVTREAGAGQVRVETDRPVTLEIVSPDGGAPRTHRCPPGVTRFPVD